MTEPAFAPAASASDLIPGTPTAGTPTPRNAAIARIAELKNDTSFLTRYAAGEGKAVEEFTAAHKVAALDPQSAEQVGREMQITTLKKLADLPEKVWEDVRNGTAVYPHEREKAEQTKKQLVRDRAWCSRYLAGDREAVSKMTLVNLILSAPVRKAEG